jgi:hypothetical protein
LPLPIAIKTPNRESKIRPFLIEQVLEASESLGWNTEEEERTKGGRARESWPDVIVHRPPQINVFDAFLMGS